MVGRGLSQRKMELYDGCGTGGSFLSKTRKKKDIIDEILDEEEKTEQEISEYEKNNLSLRDYIKENLRRTTEKDTISLIIESIVLYDEYKENKKLQKTIKYKILKS